MRELWLYDRLILQDPKIKAMAEELARDPQIKDLQEKMMGMQAQAQGESEASGKPPLFFLQECLQDKTKEGLLF